MKTSGSEDGSRTRYGQGRDRGVANDVERAMGKLLELCSDFRISSVDILTATYILFHIKALLISYLALLQISKYRQCK